MFAAIGWCVLGLVLLALGGDSIVKGAAGLGRRFGLAPFAVGLLLVAVATSLPELWVNGLAIASGQQSLALGNAVGSNVVNIGLTLAAAAIAAPLLVRWRALAPLLAVLVAGTVGVMVLGLDGLLSRVDGAVLVLAFVAVVAYALVRSKRESGELQASIADFTFTQDGLGLNLVRVLIGAALLTLGSGLIVGGLPFSLLGLDLSDSRAAMIGAALGMTPLLTGLLPLAIATALPEAAAAVAAARRGQGDIVAGHVIGSSLVNLLLVVGGIALVSPAHGLAVPASFLRLEWPAALVFALMLVPVLRGDLRVSRNEGIGLLVALAAWIAFELFLLQR